MLGVGGGMVKVQKVGVDVCGMKCRWEAVMDSGRGAFKWVEVWCGWKKGVGCRWKHGKG